MIVKLELGEDTELQSSERISNKNGLSKDTLLVVDNRTGKDYTLPIHQNSIDAMSFKQMKADRDVEAPCDQTEYGIRVYDPGFGNTAVSKSSITYKSVSFSFIPRSFLTSTQRWPQGCALLSWL